MIGPETIPRSEREPSMPALTSPTMYDLAHYVCHFFVMPELPDKAAFADLGDEYERLKAKKEILEATLIRALEDLGPIVSGLKRIKLPAIDVGDFLQLGKHRRDVRDGVFREGEIRTMHDCVLVRAACGTEGLSFDTKRPPDLSYSFFPSLEGVCSDCYLGCFHAVTAEVDPELQKSKRTELAQQLARAVFGTDKVGDWPTIALPQGVLIFGPSPDPTIQAVFVYPQGADVEMPFQIFLHELALYECAGQPEGAVLDCPSTRGDPDANDGRRSVARP
jgi:hypothetical protein